MLQLDPVMAAETALNGPFGDMVLTETLAEGTPLLESMPQSYEGPAEMEIPLPVQRYIGQAAREVNLKVQGASHFPCLLCHLGSLGI